MPDDYLSAPFRAPWHSAEWLADAEARYRRATRGLAAAAQRLVAHNGDLRDSLRLRDEVWQAADDMVRAKWLFREIVRAREILPPKPLRICHDCEEMTRRLDIGKFVLCANCCAAGENP